MADRFVFCPAAADGAGTARWRPMVVDGTRAADGWVRGGNADRCFPGKSRKTGEFGNLNLWFPISSIKSAAATGCRLSLPTAGRSRTD